MLDPYRATNQATAPTAVPARGTGIAVPTAAPEATGLASAPDPAAAAAPATPEMTAFPVGLPCSMS
jgi:hypothetical protein